MFPPSFSRIPSAPVALARSLQQNKHMHVRESQQCKQKSICTCGFCTIWQMCQTCTHMHQLRSLTLLNHVLNYYLPARSTRLILLTVSQGRSEEQVACNVIYKQVMFSIAQLRYLAIKSGVECVTGHTKISAELRPELCRYHSSLQRLLHYRDNYTCTHVYGTY